MIFGMRSKRKTPEPEPTDEIVTGEPQYPHCDTRILHAPGECEFCDGHADWQLLRKRWGIAFTGHQPQVERIGPVTRKELPCPADFNRPPDSPSDHRQWHGNTPKKGQR